MCGAAMLFLRNIIATATYVHYNIGRRRAPWVHPFARFARGEDAVEQFEEFRPASRDWYLGIPPEAGITINEMDIFS